MEDNLITKNDERIKDFFKSLDRMMENIEQLTKNCKPTLNGEKYLTDSELSEKLKISRRTLQDYRNNGTISFIQLAGKVLYRESDIQKLLDDNYREGWNK